MQFNVNHGVVKVFELIDKSPVLQRMTWAVIVIAGAVSMIHAIRWW
jgi:hypothetical protein